MGSAELLHSPSPGLIHDVLESIVLLTEQRDQRSLEQSLLQSMLEMFPGLDYWVLAYFNLDEPSLRYASDKSARLTGTVLAACEAARKKPLAAPYPDDGKRYLIFNLAVDTSHQDRLLVLSRPSWTGHDHRVVEGMVNVYKNFTHMLFDSEKDTLTGLFNRKRLERKLDEITAAHLNRRRAPDQTDQGEYLAILDLDRFKRINDTFGHMIGDEVLIIFAAILRDSLRDTDMCFRFGGEEFIVLLHDVSPDQALMVMERIRHNVEQRTFPQVGQVTVSIGFSPIDCQTRPASQIIQEADQALYYAKENGRNQVRNYQNLVETGLLAPAQQDGEMELF